MRRRSALLKGAPASAATVPFDPTVRQATPPNSPSTIRITDGRVTRTTSAARRCGDGGRLCAAHQVIDDVSGDPVRAFVAGVVHRLDADARQRRGGLVIN